MDNQLLKAYSNLSLLKTVREGAGDDDGGEGKFGLTPFTPDPNTVLSRAETGANHQIGQGPRPHPLLSRSAQFSGVDRTMTPNPVNNEHAQEKYPQLKLEAQYRHQYRQRKAPPRLTH